MGILKKCIILGVLPLLAAAYLFEAWSYLSNWVRGTCILPPKSRSAAVKCLNRSGFDAVVYNPLFAQYPVAPGTQKIFPVSGVPKALTVFCKEAGGWETFYSDRAGFSNADSVWDSGKLDATILGDSFALGECVPQSDRFAAKIQTEFPKTLNLGYPSSSLLTHLARFREFAVSRKPAKVFLMYYEGNDPTELYQELSHPVFSRYLADKNFSQNLEQNREAIGEGLKSFLSEYVEAGDPYYMQFGLLPFLQFRNTQYIVRRAMDPHRHFSLYRAFVQNGVISYGSPPDVVLKKIEEIVSLIKNETASWGGKLYFVHLPSYRKEERGFYERINSLVVSQKVPLVDMVRIFEQSKIDPYTDTWPNHYNKLGNEVLAETLLGILRGKAAGEKVAELNLNLANQ